MSTKSANIIFFLIMAILVVAFVAVGVFVFSNPAILPRHQSAELVDTLYELERIRESLLLMRRLPAEQRLQNIDSLETELSKIEKKLLDTETIELHRAKLTDETAKRADTVMRMASFIITGVSFMFGIFILAIGWLAVKKYEELKAEVRQTMEEKATIDQRFLKFRKDINRRRQNLIEKIDHFGQKIQEQSDAVDKSEKYTTSLVNELFTTALIDIVDSLAKNKLITDSEDESLRAKITEIQYRLFLVHPDQEERMRAVYGLIGVGTVASVASLKEIVENREEEADLRLLAQNAIQAIKKRSESGIQSA